MARTWEICDIDHGNKRTVTLEQYRAELEAAKKLALENLAKSAAAVQKRRG